jgi:hypothetical protein
MPRKRIPRGQLTAEQAQRLEDRLNLNRPDTPWYGDWCQRRGRLLEARRHATPDYLTIKRP